MLFLLGFVLAIVGFALVVVGKITFSADWVVPARTSRTCGAILLAFFPLVFAARFGLRQLDWEEKVNVTTINWVIFWACLVGSGFWFLVAARPRQTPAERPERALNPFTAPVAVDPSPMPATEAPPPLPRRQSAPRPPPSAKNPFDFS